MRLVRFNPYRDTNSMQDRISRLFFVLRSSVAALWRSWWRCGQASRADCRPPARGRSPSPPANRSVPLPPYRQRVREDEVGNENFHQVERFYGSFTRTFALPTTVDVPKIHASYKDGVLEVVLPKAETAKAKRIEIKAA